MNNTYSLTYFLPELILLVNIIFHFIISDGKSKKLIILRNSSLLISLVITLLLEIVCWPNRSTGLFFNSFILNPFTILISIFLILFFIIFEYRNIWQNRTSFSNNILLQKLIYLTASILLVKANSITGVIVCIGLIMLNNINYFHLQNSDKDNYQFFLLSNLLTFSLVLFGLVLYYGVTKSVFIRAEAIGKDFVNPNAMVFSFTALLVLLGFGLYAFILSFGKINGKQSFSFDTSSSNSVFFIPLFAFWGITFRILRNLLSASGAESVVKNFQTFILTGSILLIVAASLYFSSRQKPSGLFHIALIIHLALAIPGFSLISPDITALSIYLLITTILTFSALTMFTKNNVGNHLSKITVIILYLNILGIPGGSGFTARFLLFRSLFRANIPLIYIILLMLSLLPLMVYVTIEILRISKLIPSFEKQKTRFIPFILTGIVISLGIYWEPFYNLILNSLR